MTDVVRARSGGVEIETKQGPFHSGGASIVDRGNNREQKGEGRTKNWLRRRSGVSLAPFFLSEAAALMSGRSRGSAMDHGPAAKSLRGEPRRYKQNEYEGALQS
jgi:hypothetical protein